MATIQLGQEILAVEALIDERSHDPAFRQLVLTRERFGRRPEYRYLQALFDATFQVRTDRELLREVTALVAEQPDFTEAVSLLAFLYDRVGDRAKAEVFAREALHSQNPQALARARAVLGMPAPAAQAPRRERLASTPPAGSPARLPSQPPPPLDTSDPYQMQSRGQRPQPVYTPSPTGALDRERTKTRAMLPAESGGFSSREVETAPGRDLSPMPPPPDPLSERPAPSSPSNPELPPLETITFKPVGGMPPPPSIPPSAIIGADKVEIPKEPPAPTRESPTLPGFAQVRVEDMRPDRPARTLTPPVAPIITQGAPSPGSQSSPAEREQVERLSLDLAVDRVGPESRAQPRPSRPAMAIPPPVEVQRHWLKYAREHQVSTRESRTESTALTLLDLAERVMEGRTPLASEPVPLDRRGLIFVEQKLEQFRNNKGTVSPAERAATTSAAAFLLAVLMKEAEARAVDTTPEDGACKAVLPSGASVRPLLIAASFARGRGPGLVESYDRAATAHMQRAPRAPAQTHRYPPVEGEVQAPPRSSLGSTQRSATRRAPMSVPRRDLDAGTLCLVDPGAPMGSPPPINLRGMAEEFWNSAAGQEVAGASRRAGSFTLADIDAIERHSTRAFSLVGLWPPGNPWPWVPTEEQQKQILLWGAILGEVLIGVYTGRWEVDPSDPQDRELYRVVLAGSVVAWPLAKVYLRLARGVSHDLSIFVDVIGRIVGRQASRSLTV